MSGPLFSWRAQLGKLAEDMLLSNRCSDITLALSAAWVTNCWSGGRSDQLGSVEHGDERELRIAARPSGDLARLIAGLLYLQHAFDLSDEDVVWQWLENPYWQVFMGETYLQTKPALRNC